MEGSLVLAIVPGTYAVCRLPAADPVPEWATAGEVFSITRTPDELSILCAQHLVPAGTQAERDWCCLRVDDILDFGLIGILAEISAVLAKALVSIFVVSTFNTDYVLVKARQFEQAIAALVEAGYEVRR
jgi:hypothetical protein